MNFDNTLDNLKLLEAKCLTLIDNNKKEKKFATINSTNSIYISPLKESKYHLSITKSKNNLQNDNSFDNKDVIKKISFIPNLNTENIINDSFIISEGKDENESSNAIKTLHDYSNQIEYKINGHRDNNSEVHNISNLLSPGSSYNSATDRDNQDFNGSKDTHEIVLNQKDKSIFYSDANLKKNLVNLNNENIAASFVKFQNTKNIYGKNKIKLKNRNCMIQKVTSNIIPLKLSDMMQLQHRKKSLKYELKQNVNIKNKFKNSIVLNNINDKTLKLSKCKITTTTIESLKNILFIHDNNIKKGLKVNEPFNYNFIPIVIVPFTDAKPNQKLNSDYKIFRIPNQLYNYTKYLSNKNIIIEKSDSFSKNDVKNRKFIENIKYNEIHIANNKVKPAKIKINKKVENLFTNSEEFEKNLCFSNIDMNAKTTRNIENENIMGRSDCLSKNKIQNIEFIEKINDEEEMHVSSNKSPLTEMRRNEEIQNRIVNVQKLEKFVYSSNINMNDTLKETRFINNLKNNLFLPPYSQILGNIGLNLVKESVQTDINKYCYGQNCDTEIKRYCDNAKSEIIKINRPYKVNWKKCFCKYNYNLSNVLEMHHKMLRPNGKNIFKCCICFSNKIQAFFNESKYYDHLLNKHGLLYIMEPKNIIECNDCPLTISIRNYAKHLQKCSKDFLKFPALKLQDEDIRLFTSNQNKKPNLVKFLKYIENLNNVANSKNIDYIKKFMRNVISNSKIITPSLKPNHYNESIFSGFNANSNSQLSSTTYQTAYNTFLQYYDAKFKNMTDCSQSDFGSILNNKNVTNRVDNGCQEISKKSNNIDPVPIIIEPDDILENEEKLIYRCYLCGFESISQIEFNKHIIDKHGRYNVPLPNYSANTNIANYPPVKIRNPSNIIIIRTPVIESNKILYSNPKSQNVNGFKNTNIFKKNILNNLLQNKTHFTPILPRQPIGSSNFLPENMPTVAKNDSMHSDFSQSYKNENLMLTNSSGNEFNSSRYINPLSNSKIKVLNMEALLTNSNPKELLEIKFKSNENIVKDKKWLNSLSNKKAKKFKCKKCSVRFNMLFELKLHYKEIHQFKCERCNSFWPSMNLYNNHMDMNHGINQEKCTICDDHVKLGVPMTRHLQRSHTKICHVIITPLSNEELSKYIDMENYVTPLKSKPIKSLRPIHKRIRSSKKRINGTDIGNSFNDDTLLKIQKLQLNSEIEVANVNKRIKNCSKMNSNIIVCDSDSDDNKAL